MKYFLAFILTFSLFAKEVPALSSPVIDQAGLLSNQERQVLENALVQIKNQTGHEIALLTVDSLEDESLEGYSIKVTDQWKLGTKDRDNGVLFLISLNDRKMRIEVGQGLEGDLPDIKAGRIISAVQPYFKKGDYGSGIFLGISEIAKNIGVELRGTPKVQNRRSQGFNPLLLIIIFFLFSMIFGGRGGRGFVTGMVLGGMMGGGRSSGYRGGGGFGGGGGFSGGGSSGSW